MSEHHQPGLFDRPAPRAVRPQARVVLLCGPSGSGKTSLTRRLGLPVLQLDHFYRDADDARTDPPMPHRFGIIDWDDPDSWDGRAALETLVRLRVAGAADVPVYDIATSRRTGTTRLDLADALCLRLRPAVTFWRRLARDLAESRKPPLTLVRRGLGLRRDEPALVQQWVALGCRPVSVAEAEAAVRAVTSR